jgi:hypothetical protein
MSGRKQVQQCWCRRANLFNHLVGARQEGRRHGEAERLGGAQVDDEFELGWLLDRQVGGARTLDDPVDQRRRAPEVFRGSKTSGRRPELPLERHESWKVVRESDVGDLLAMAEQQIIGDENGGLRFRSCRIVERGLQIRHSFEFTRCDALPTRLVDSEHRLGVAKTFSQTTRHSHSRTCAITSPNSSKAADQTSADTKLAN